MTTKGAFRFAYFSSKYEETCAFYKNQLNLELEHSWDRSANDKGSLFKCGVGLIEVLHLPAGDEHRSDGLDYRTPKGAFMCIEVSNVDALFETFKSRDIRFSQELTNQSWGHRSYSVIEPNGLTLFFCRDL